MNQIQCAPEQLEFQGLGRRSVVADFDGGTITSEGGALLLRELDQRSGIVNRFAACFVDRRNAAYWEHPVHRLVAQRVYGLCLGYEDLNDHEYLRFDPLFATLCDQQDPEGRHRVRSADVGKALAGALHPNQAIDLSQIDYPSLDVIMRYTENATPGFGDRIPPSVTEIAVTGLSQSWLISGDLTAASGSSKPTRSLPRNEPSSKSQRRGSRPRLLAGQADLRCPALNTRRAALRAARKCLETRQVSACQRLTAAHSSTCA